LLKKRYTIVTALTIVSVLLGSLLYVNITIAQKGKEPTVYKDSVEIAVLDWSSRGLYFGQNPQDTGVTLGGDFSPMTLPFAFSPKEVFQNVTDLWIRFTAQNTWPDPKTIVVDISLNDGMEISTSEYYPKADWDSKVVSAHITDPNVHKTIIQGINKLTLASSIEFHIFRVTVFIEYKYQAR